MKHQVELEARNIRDVQSFDKCERSMKTVRDLGLKSKLFCKTDQPSESGFLVRSDRWDWLLLPVESSQKPIPLYLMKDLELLARRGLDFQDYWIAEPKIPHYDPLSVVVREEIQSTANRIKKGAKKAKAALAEAEAKAKRIANSVLRDPILLGRQGPYFVELLRWR